MNYDVQSLAAVIEQRRDIMLTPHFRLSELIRTTHGADNWPSSPDEILRLQYICHWVLERVRGQFGRSVKVNSGYRSKAVNDLVGGSVKSQHMKAEAVDFEVPGIANAEIALWIKGNLVFDQLILEFYTAGEPSSGWVHCSLVRQGNRRSVLTAQKNRKTGRITYLPGLQT
ncbi:D-Ala-D-Ala carboxypeptidase family metallohydrolase [Novosphingobium kaempferiae]|uniref:D-Ala-D-Ala carboxypeptidase family metallohydrolase n=1 Tax=Novosphingobium kaempferiae TaxID=2896849 RepID=UPI001E355D68|nr:D-Ala-D-Ala carboxypeptidase family metallohydrolase [Novosphingobium kaempferiae]